MVTVRELSTGRKYTHNDRLSNSLFSGKTGEPEPEPEHKPNAKPDKNLKEPEKHAEAFADLKEALMRTRSVRVVRPRGNKEFDYTGVLPLFRSKQTSKIRAFQMAHILQPLFIQFQTLVVSLNL